MAKNQNIQIRVGESLKQRYYQALKDNAPDPDHVQSATDHLTAFIIKYVEESERKHGKNRNKLIRDMTERAAHQNDEGLNRLSD